MANEKQGILEDGDSSHRDGADGTDDHTGSIQLYVTFTPRELLKTLGGYFHEADMGHFPFTH